MPNITIHAVRHAEGFHNLNSENHGIRDPDLTPKGLQQCADLKASFPHHSKITHLVASPLRRTIYTCLYTFSTPTAAGQQTKSVITLPEIQETSSLPCDTGSAPIRLTAEFADPENPFHGQVDLHLMHVGWNHKGPGSKWSPEKKHLEARAKAARRWLRDLGQKSGDDAEIVVVTHGGYLHYFTDDWDGHDRFVGTGWSNTEWRSYQFRSEDDEGAALVETEESKSKRQAKPLTETEQRQLKAVAEGQWQGAGFQTPPQEPEL